MPLADSPAAANHPTPTEQHRERIASQSIRRRHIDFLQRTLFHTFHPGFALERNTMLVTLSILGVPGKIMMDVMDTAVGLADNENRVLVTSTDVKRARQIVMRKRARQIARRTRAEIK